MAQEIEFKLGAPALAQLAALATNADKLGQIEQIVSAAGVVSDIRSITKRVTSEAAISSTDATKVVRSLVNLYNMLADMAISPGELIDALTSYLEHRVAESWRGAHISNWKSAKSRIIDTLSSIKDDSPLATFAKSREVTFGHQNLYEGARIFTSIRPVFNRNGDKILQMIVSHELVLEYYAGTGSETRKIEVSMNATELAELKNQCERAQRKAGTVKLAFTGQPWQTTIASNPAPEGYDDDN